MTIFVQESCYADPKLEVSLSDDGSMTIQSVDYNHKNSSSNKVTRKELVEHSIFEALLYALVTLLLTGLYDSVQVLYRALFDRIHIVK